MRRHHSTLLLATIGGSFAWHVLSMIFMSSVVIVTVGDPNAGYRTIDFTEIDFAYEMVKPSQSITKHFEPPKIPLVEDEPGKGIVVKNPLNVITGERKLFDSGFAIADKIPTDSGQNYPLGLPPSTLDPQENKKINLQNNDVKVKSGVYNKRGQLVNRTIVFKPSIPNYPLWAEVQGREFRARFSLTVTPGGRVVRVKIISSSGSSDIDRISISYLRKWKFVAIAAKKGIQTYIVPIGFVLKR